MCLNSSFEGDDNSSYNLLLMCSSEREDGSFLASAWDEYRILSHRCPSHEEAAEFLTTQLIFNPATDHSRYVYAASADKERYV